MTPLRSTREEMIMRMQIVTVSGQAKPGREFEYWLAWKHRFIVGDLARQTPWWQPIKKWRRQKWWFKIMDRWHAAACDKITYVDL